MPSLRRRSLALAVSLSLVAPTFTALTETDVHAQAKRKPIRDQLPPEAQTHWDNAVSLYKLGRWADARTSFMSAYDASKNPRVLFNAAVCEKNLAHYAKAIDLYKRQLAEGAGKLAADEEAEVKTQIAGLEKLLAPVTITVSEPGADVFVDDERIGTSPLSGPTLVSFGERRVRATKAGFVDAAESVELKPGESKQISLKLAPTRKTGRVRVSVKGPKSADILVDKKRIAATDPGTGTWEGDVEATVEPHEFTFQAPGYVSVSETHVIEDGKVKPFSIEMSPEAQMGKLVIAVTQPEGATIQVDKEIVGSTRWEGPVKAGVHQVTVKKQGHYTWSQDVEVKPGAERPITVTLNEDRNTSFVPWLIGTVVVIGAGAFATWAIAKPSDEVPVNGTLAPFTVETRGFRFR